MLTLTPAEAALVGRIVAAHTEAEVAVVNAKADPAAHASLVAKLRRLLGEDAAPAVQPDESPDHAREFDDRMDILTHGG